jgi:hypothetical protein
MPRTYHARFAIDVFDITKAERAARMITRAVERKELPVVVEH